MAKKIIIAELDIKSKDLAAANAKLLKQMTALKDRQKDVRKATNNLTNANQKQLKSYVNTDAKLKKINQDYAQNKAVMAEVTTGVLTLSNALTKEVRTLNEAAKNTRKLTKLKGDLNIKNKDGKRALDEINKKLDSNTKFVKKNSDAMSKQRLEIGNYSGALDRVIPGLSAFIAGLLGTTRAIGGTILALGSLKIALLATGIGAFLVIIGTTVAAMMRFTVFTDAMKVELAPLAVLLNILMDRFGRFGFALIALASGRTAEGIDNLRKAFKGLGDEIEREVDMAKDLKRISIILERDAKLFEAFKEASLTFIQEQRAIGRDKLRDDQERLQAMIEAAEVQDKISKKSIEFANRELAAALDQMDAQGKMGELSAEALEFVERIRDGQIGSLEAQRIAKELTLDDAKAKETLFLVIDKIIAREKEMQSITQKNIRIIFTLNTVREQILIKQIAGLKARAKLLKLQSEDEELSIKKRVELIELAWDQEMQANLAALEGNKINNDQFEAERLILIRGTQAKIDQIYLDSANKAAKALKLQLEEEAKLLKEKEDAAEERTKREEDRLKRRFKNETDRQREFDEGRKLAKAILFDEEMLRLEEEGATRLALKLTELDEQKRLDNERATNTIKDKQLLERELALIEEQYGKIREKITFELEMIKLNNAKNIASQMGAIFEKHTVLGKAAAIAQATINSLQGAAAAVAPPPIGAGPLLGPILAAITIATGLATIRKIMGIGIPKRFAEGTKRVLGPGSDTSDLVPALLSRNERIVDAKNNRKIGFDLSNDQLASAAQIYRGLILNQYSNSMNDKGIISEIKTLNKTLKNKPVSHTSIQISEGFKVFNRKKYLS